MMLFDPAVHSGGQTYPGQTPLSRAARAYPGLTLIPRVEDCETLWDNYGMLDNIREHSRKVADLAWAIALAAEQKGLAVRPDVVRAAGLLHDLGKTYSIAHGGSHAQLGAAWVMRETRNAPLAQAVLFHVYWPWEERTDEDTLLLVFAIVYADKRVKHDTYVDLDDRFADLVLRYGSSEFIRSRIQMSLEQGKRIEAALSRRLGIHLHEHTADNGRLVKRT